MIQMLRRTRLKVIAEMTSSPAFNSNIQRYGHMRNGLFMIPAPPRPSPWYVLFANEYLRADNPAAFHTECTHSLLLIELRTRARVEAQNKQTKKNSEGHDRLFLASEIKKMKSIFFFPPAWEGIQRRADVY